MRIAARFSGPGQPYHGLARMTAKGPRWTGKVVFVEKRLEDPLHWKHPRRIFLSSMTDVFHKRVPVAWLNRIFGIMHRASWHSFQVLTKRTERMAALVPALRLPDGRPWADAPPKHIWLGTSVEDGRMAEKRIPVLTPSPNKGAIVLAADSWKIPPEMMEQAFQEVLSKAIVPEFLGPQAALRCAVIGVKRFITGSKQLVRVEIHYDTLLTPAN